MKLTNIFSFVIQKFVLMLICTISSQQLIRSHCQKVREETLTAEDGTDLEHTKI